MEACTLNSRDYLDEAFRIVRGDRSVTGLPILPEIEHIVALYHELIETRVHLAAVLDDSENQKAVAINFGKENA